MFKRLLSIAMDMAAVAVATILALLLRDNFETRSDQLIAFLPYVGLTLLCTALVLIVFRLTRAVWRLSTLGDYVRIAVACAIAITAAMAMSFVLNRLENVARSLPIIQFMLMVFLLIGQRLAVRMLHSWLSAPKSQTRSIPDFDRSIENVLVVGVNRLANFYVRSAQEFGRDSTRIAGVLSTEKANLGRTVGSHQVVGGLEQAEDIIKSLGVHGVFVTRIAVMMAADHLTAMERQILFAAGNRFQIPVEFIAETLGFAGRGKRVLAVKPTREDKLTRSVNRQIEVYARRRYWRIKRGLDIAAATLLIIAMAPIFLMTALLVAFDVGFPAIFWQQRPGARGVPFRVYKFRTMAGSHDAEGKLLDDADRVSSIGRFMRRTRLDELPQLFNVLAGDMSFVGPRPLLPRDQFNGLKARMVIPPGITGWAQINGGRDVSAAEKAALDVWYVKHASLRVDLHIIVRTLVMVVRGETRNEQAIQAAWREVLSERKRAKQRLDVGSTPPAEQVPHYVTTLVHERASQASA